MFFCINKTIKLKLDKVNQRFILKIQKKLERKHSFVRQEFLEFHLKIKGFLDFPRIFAIFASQLKLGKIKWRENSLIEKLHI